MKRMTTEKFDGCIGKRFKRKLETTRKGNEL